MNDEDREKQPDKVGGFQGVGDVAQRFMQGYLPFAEDSAALVAATSKRPARRPPEDKLAVAAEAIAARPPDKDLGEIVYTMRELVQCNFPIRDPGDVPAWTRKNGNITLIIQPGIDPDTGLSLGIPRGEWPRLLMRFFQKRAVMTQRKVISLGPTTNEVVRTTGGRDTGRGKRGDAKRMLTELQRLIYSRITIVDKSIVAQRNRQTNLDMPVSQFSETWWSLDKPDQPSLFTSEIVLGDALFKAFIDDPIPVDLRVLLALKHSLKQASFAMDIYDWQQSHLFRMRQNKQKDQKIKWKYLPDQFGAEFGRLRDWKASFDENFNHVERLSPALTHEFDGEYLILEDTGFRSGLLPMTGRRMERVLNQVTPKSREWFYRTFPLHTGDLAEIEDAFNHWRENPKDGQPIISRNPDKHFESFVRYNWFKQPKPQRG